MTSLPLHTSVAASKPEFPPTTKVNPLPKLLQTPSGLALLELQGTINLPEHNDVDSIAAEGGRETPIGRLIFPDYVEGEEGQGWMKRVYLYVGKHQRLTGEVKKLPKAVAVIRKRAVSSPGNGSGEEDGMEALEGQEELEIVEIVKFKVLFSIRPEPVGTWEAGD